MISKHGAPLISEEARAVLAEELLPFAFLVTPNLQEASVLAGMSVQELPDMIEASRRIHALGVPGVLVKGGHLPGEAVDVLYWQGRDLQFRAARLDTPHTHGTGCTFSAAITAELAKGRELPDAVTTAKRYVTRAIETHPGLGKGYGPVNHHADP